MRHIFCCIIICGRLFYLSIFYIFPIKVTSHFTLRSWNKYDIRLEIRFSWLTASHICIYLDSGQWSVCIVHLSPFASIIHGSIASTQLFQEMELIYCIWPKLVLNCNRLCFPRRFRFDKPKGHFNQEFALCLLNLLPPSFGKSHN